MYEIQIPEVHNVVVIPDEIPEKTTSVDIGGSFVVNPFDIGFGSLVKLLGFAARFGACVKQRRNRLIPILKWLYRIRVQTRVETSS